MFNRRSVRILIYLLILPIFLGTGFAGGVLVDHFVITPAVVSANTTSQSNSLDLVNQAYQIIQQNYVDRSAVQQIPLEYGAISGMVNALGDTGHSTFLSPHMVNQLQQDQKGRLKGIGIEIAMQSGHLVIVSPIDGTVVARNIDVGQSVAAALQAPNVFSVAQDLTRMQVYVAVDESDTGNIRVGAPVTFQVDAFPTALFHGRVTAIRLNPTTVQNVVTYSVVVNFDNPEEKLLPGETAYVTIPTGHAADAVLIPNPALTFKPSMPTKELQQLYKEHKISHEASTTHLGGWQVVWKVGPDKQSLIPLAVQCGITDYSNTEMTQGDLHEGDALVTTQQTQGTSRTATPPGFGGPRRGPR